MTLSDQDNQPVVVGDKLWADSEAEIFSVTGDPALTAKVYLKMSPAHSAKLQAMVKNRPGDPARDPEHVSICWPQSLLFDPPGTCAGYLMDRAGPAAVPLDQLYNPQDRRRFAPGLHWGDLLEIAANIACAAETLHHYGHVIGDLSGSNTLVSDHGSISMVNCDTMQISEAGGREVFRCTTVKPEFTAPEFQGCDFSQTDLDAAQDNFALGVMIFRLLMEGMHPFSTAGQENGNAPAVADRISRGDCPFSGHKRVGRVAAALPYDDFFPHTLKSLVIRCFGYGHKSPVARPLPREWRLALRDLQNNLSICKVNQRHIYSNHLLQCPWCESTALLRVDPYPPAPPAVQPLPASPPPATPQPEVFAEARTAPESPAVPAVGLFADTRIIPKHAELANFRIPPRVWALSTLLVLILGTWGGYKVYEYQLTPEQRAERQLAGERAAALELAERLWAEKEETRRRLAEQKKQEEEERLRIEKRKAAERVLAEKKEADRKRKEQLETERRQAEEKRLLDENKAAELLKAEQEKKKEAQQLLDEQEKKKEAQRLLAEQETKKEAEQLLDEQEKKKEAQRLLAKQEKKKEDQRLLAENLAAGRPVAESMEAAFADSTAKKEAAAKKAAEAAVKEGAAKQAELQAALATEATEIEAARQAAEAAERQKFALLQAETERMLAEEREARRLEALRAPVFVAEAVFEARPENVFERGKKVFKDNNENVSSSDENQCVITTTSYSFSCKNGDRGKTIVRLSFNPQIQGGGQAKAFADKFMREMKTGLAASDILDRF